MQTKILVADNDPVHLRTMKDFLKGKGYAVVVAGGVVEARRALQEGKVDLAILDVRLSEDTDAKDISGLTLARTLAPQIPKIVLTRYPTYTAVREALRSVRGRNPAAIDFVSKPEGLPAIQRAIEGAVNHAIRALQYRTFFHDLQSGDRTAWRRLWDEEAWRLITLVQRHGIGAADAKNICVQVFREVAEAERPPRSLSLKTALVAKVLQKIKALESRKPSGQKSRRRSAGVKISESVINEELREDIVAPVIKNEISPETLVEQLQWAIKDLAVKEQKAIVMHLFEGLSVKDIAKSLGVGEKTVGKYLKNASAHLKSKLAEME